MTERLFLRLDGDPLYAPETNVPAGTMREFAVPAPLRECVSNVAAYREFIPAGHEVVERVLPDGAVHLIFNLGDVPSAGTGTGLAVEAAGASAAPTVLRLRGRLEAVSVTLRPGAVAAVLGVPAGEIGGSSVSLDELWHGEGTRMLERMAEVPDDASRVAVLEAALRRRLGGGDNAVQRHATRALHLIAESGGRRPLREVADAIGVGERRLQQIFHAQVGLSPRAWSRLARLHACLRALRQRPAPRWPLVALDAGFYDQSHLVNEFQSLCGLTPGMFLEHAVSGSSKTAG
jgi:AraC-like DNA-binding protein